MGKGGTAALECWVEWGVDKVKEAKWDMRYAQWECYFAASQPVRPTP